MTFSKKIIKSLGVGTLCGLINGFLGAGGGIIATYYLSHALEDEQKTKNGVFANAVATMMPVSLCSIVLYVLSGHIKLDNTLWGLIPPGVIGGTIGAFLLTRLKFDIVKAIVAILVVVSGIMMIFKAG